MRHTKKLMAEGGSNTDSPSIDSMVILDPQTLPEVYAAPLGCDLDETMPAGSIIMVSTVGPCYPGDWVVIYARPEYVRSGGANFAIRQLVAAIPSGQFPYDPDGPGAEVCVCCATDDPDMMQTIRARALLAVHRILGPVPEGVELGEAILPTLGGAPANAQRRGFQ